MNKNLEMNLQLFADGGADAGAAGVDTTQDTGENAAVAGQNGENAPAAEENTQNREAEFDRLIKGDYKDIYSKKVQSIVQSRLKGSKETVEKYNTIAPALELLATKYGVDGADLAALAEAISSDDELLEDEALERGMTVENLRDLKQLERQNRSLTRQLEQQAATKQYDLWMQQADDTAKVYPDFNLEAEMQNDQFVQLLRSNIDVKTAYEVIHKDEIIPQAMHFAAAKAEQQVANAVRANGKRATENGSSSRSAVTPTSDVSKLSKQARQDLLARAARGERIVL